MKKILAVILALPALLLCTLSIGTFITGEISLAIFSLILTAGLGLAIFKLLKQSAADQQTVAMQMKLVSTSRPAKRDDVEIALEGITSCTILPAELVETKKPLISRPAKRDDVKTELEGIASCTILPAELVETKKPLSSMPELKYKNLTKRSYPERFERFVAIDTETTGLSASKDDIIEVAAVRFVNRHPVEIFHTLCRPQRPIPAKASEINGITNDDVKDSPAFGAIVTQLQDFVGDDIMVAHNADFDMKFLHCGGFDLSRHKEAVYDTLQLARFKFKDDDGYRLGSYKLGDICDYVGIHVEDLHSARTDATACGLLFLEILDTVFEK